MGDPLGLLKVTVVRGKGLVIRDFKSSDPYVVIKVGDQVVSGFVFTESIPPSLRASLFSFQRSEDGPVFAVIVGIFVELFSAWK